MENNSFASNLYETPTESPDKNKKQSKEKSSSSKKSSPAEGLRNDKKQQAERRIAQSIDALSLVEQPRVTKPNAEKTNENPEANAAVESLSPEETKYSEQTIASQHLENLRQTDIETREQLALAENFLELVSDGEDIESAFAAVAAENGMNEDEIAAALTTMTEVEPEPAEFTNPLEMSDSEAINVQATASSPQSVTHAAGGGNATVTGFTQAPERLSREASTYYEQPNHGGDMLLGGVVGYLIGRRRGRIKSEKQLLPVQRKLKQQVVNLERVITQKEQQLTLVATGNRGRSSAEASNAGARRPEIPTASGPLERTQPGRRETRLGMEKPVRAEHLGHMIVAAEAPTKIIESTRIERPGNIRAAFRAEEVKTMNRHQLLELSEKITVEGASLRHIYESNLIGERQLRHLVGEYLDGKDIHDELRHHMVEHDIDFERDPLVRDRIRSRSATKSNGSGLNELLASAGLVTEAPNTALEQRIQRDEQRKSDEKQHSNRQRALADAAMATAIIVLAVAVVILVARS